MLFKVVEKSGPKKYPILTKVTYIPHASGDKLVLEFVGILFATIPCSAGLNNPIPSPSRRVLSKKGVKSRKLPRNTKPSMIRRELKIIIRFLPNLSEKPPVTMGEKF